MQILENNRLQSVTGSIDETSEDFDTIPDTLPGTEAGVDQCIADFNKFCDGLVLEEKMTVTEFVILPSYRIASRYMQIRIGNQKAFATIEAWFKKNSGLFLKRKV